MNGSTLYSSLPPGVVDELLSSHGIAVDIFSVGALTLGVDQGYTNAINSFAKTKFHEVAQQDRPSIEISADQRMINRNASRKIKQANEDDWNLYSVPISSRGIISKGVEFAGHRLHPRHRTGSKEEVKFDTSGSNVRIFLPVLSWQGAYDLLEHHGFLLSPDNYEPYLAWEFIFSNPEISICIEESALKAMAATSIGQLAVGINGINSAGQKTRSDRLRKPLEMLAKGGREILVRFDSGNQSMAQARRLNSQLEKAGAQSGWYCWLGGPGRPEKTDDYIAAKLRGLSIPAHLPILGNQENLRITGKAILPRYTRLNTEWFTTSIDREFSGDDIASACRSSRVVALAGATGTGKTKASVAAVDLLDQKHGKRLTVLGIYHRASLVHKGAAEFGVRDMSAPRGSIERERGLHEGVVCRDGLFCCCESIKKEKGDELDMFRLSFELENKPRPTILFLDELSQTMMHLLIGGTDGLTKTRSAAVASLERLLKNPCVTVIAAESGLGDLELSWLRDITGAIPAVIHSSFVRERILYIGQVSKDNISALQQVASETLESGCNVWISMGQASSVSSFSLPFVNSYNSLVITSENSSSEEVSRFMADTETVGPEYSLVAFSPSVTSGISLTSPVGLSACVQQFAMGPEDALQALDRARNSSNRVLLFPRSAPAAVVGSRETSIQGVISAKTTNATRGQEKTYCDFWSKIEPATRRFAIALESRNNQEALQNEHVLKCRLIEQGYRLKPFDEFVVERPRRVVTAQDREKASGQNNLSFKTKLLKQLCLGLIHIGQAQEIARIEAIGGLACDYEAVDPSSDWYWLQRLGVPALVSIGQYHQGSNEFLFTENEIRTLIKTEAKELRFVLGGRIVIPGPDDEIKASFINALLRYAGFTPKFSGKVRVNGTQVNRYGVRINL